MPPPMYGGALCPGNVSETVISCFDSCPSKFNLDKLMGKRIKVVYNLTVVLQN